MPPALKFSGKAEMIMLLVLSIPRDLNQIFGTQMEALGDGGMHICKNETC